MKLKFKGKCLKTGNWIFGGYAEKCIQANAMVAEVAIIPDRCYGVAVDPKTVSIAIGVDMYGKDLYSGDIILDVGKYKNGSGEKFEVRFDPFIGATIFIDDEYEDSLEDPQEWARIVGSVHDGN